LFVRSHPWTRHKTYCGRFLGGPDAHHRIGAESHRNDYKKKPLVKAYLLFFSSVKYLWIIRGRTAFWNSPYKDQILLVGQAVPVPGPGFDFHSMFDVDDP
jgi:hypothetical protein